MRGAPPSRFDTGLRCRVNERLSLTLFRSPSEPRGERDSRAFSAIRPPSSFILHPFSLISHPYRSAFGSRWRSHSAAARASRWSSSTRQTACVIGISISSRSAMLASSRAVLTPSAT